MFGYDVATINEQETGNTKCVLKFKKINPFLLQRLIVYKFYGALRKTYRNATPPHWLLFKFDRKSL